MQKLLELMKHGDESRWILPEVGFAGNTAMRQALSPVMHQRVQSSLTILSTSLCRSGLVKAIDLSEQSMSLVSVEAVSGSQVLLELGPEVGS